MGHSVVRVGDASEALRKLEEDDRFDLRFSDVVMPGDMNGLDLARLIRRRWPSLPVVLATGYNEAAGNPEDEGFPLLRKPYRMEDLQSAIVSALEDAPLRKPQRRHGDNVVPLTWDR